MSRTYEVTVPSCCAEFFQAMAEVFQWTEEDAVLTALAIGKSGLSAMAQVKAEPHLQDAVQRACEHSWAAISWIYEAQNDAERTG